MDVYEFLRKSKAPHNPYLDKKDSKYAGKEVWTVKEDGKKCCGGKEVWTIKKEKEKFRGKEVWTVKE